MIRDNILWYKNLKNHNKKSRFKIQIIGSLTSIIVGNTY